LTNVEYDRFPEYKAPPANRELEGFAGRFDIYSQDTLSSHFPTITSVNEPKYRLIYDAIASQSVLPCLRVTISANGTGEVSGPAWKDPTTSELIDPICVSGGVTTFVPHLPEVAFGGFAATLALGTPKYEERKHGMVAGSGELKMWKVWGEADSPRELLVGEGAFFAIHRPVPGSNGWQDSTWLKPMRFWAVRVREGEDDGISHEERRELSLKPATELFTGAMEAFLADANADYTDSDSDSEGYDSEEDTEDDDKSGGGDLWDYLQDDSTDIELGDCPSERSELLDCDCFSDSVGGSTN
jgi:hypothetical protein